MGCHTDTYILIGTPVAKDWGALPTDEPDSDDWYDRHKDLVIYEPKRGDLVHFANIDGKCPYVGRVVNMDKGKWSHGTEFFEAFDVERLTREIAEVAAILLERFGMTDPVKLHIVSNVT